MPLNYLVKNPTLSQDYTILYYTSKAVNYTYFNKDILIAISHIS